MTKRKQYYRTLLSVSYRAREVKTNDTPIDGRICQYYVFVISDEKDRYSPHQLENVLNHFSQIMSRGAERNDNRWRNSVIQESVPVKSFSSTGYEDNIRIDLDEGKGFMRNRVYRSAIFFKNEGDIEYGEADIRRIEQRLNDKGELKTVMDWDTGKIVRLWR